MSRVMGKHPSFVPKLLFVGGLVAVVFVANAVFSEFQRRRAVQREIKEIEAEVTKTEQRRVQLTDLLQRADTSEFIEREARLRLDLRKPGETVLVVPTDGTGISPTGGTASSVPASSSNIKKWWRHIFGP